MENPSSKNQEKPHAILVALPFQGHVIPSVQLAIKLASNGFSVTFINAEHIHDKITRSNPTGNDIFNETELDIEYMTVSDGLPVEYDRSLNQESWGYAHIHCYPAHVEVAVAKIVRARGPAVKCLIADVYSLWASTMAKKFGILHVSFWTQAALVLDIYFHVHLLMENGHVGSAASKDMIHYLPGIESIKPTDLMSDLQEKDLTTGVHQVIFGCINDAKRADFILCNTAQELEIETISAIQAHIPFYAIGPLFPPEFTKSTVSTSLWAESDCTQWLNTKPPKSVLYVSFGSYAHISKKDIEEIAEGIKLSGVDFLWVIRPGMVSSDDPDPLPAGFRDEVDGRGMVVTWTCQKEVLSHCAVGGFLTHCGWNSTLESVWCGVPFLCFPLTADQLPNRKLIVDDWKIGCYLCDEETVTREEMSQKIRLLMSDPKGYEFKDNIKKVKQILCRAMEPGGSSQKNLEAFIKDMKAKI